ncbi:helicase-exonuclease AddAB subunit AddA [Listeria costaricensis]|uniref:helicase-exonuclease AddAB subunit AddA n=1 Tax=Listeria costaricensis TaxID=2026604 RepID=UPI000C077DF5|nr:helicase-exonuclease AddAB subunit AddA [Listeria costaricensis]
MKQIPKKPQDATWTDEQWRAIHADGQNILVAAAAGSGKTAVLVTRIIEKLKQEDSRVQVDELLVVTFTNASAAEMKHRIGQALENELLKTPDSVHLRKQLALLSNTSISTLHSFCLDLIRKYYYQTDIDPDFRLIEPIESGMIRDEVLDELLEEQYSMAENDAFFHLADAITGDRSDQGLYDLLIKLYEFSEANPEPNKWLQSLSDYYQTAQMESLADLDYYPLILKAINMSLDQAISELAYAVQLAEQAGGPDVYLPLLKEEKQQLCQIKAAETMDFSSLAEVWKAIQFKRLPTLKKKEEYDALLVDATKKARDTAKKAVQQVMNDWFTRTEQQYLDDLSAMLPDVKALVSLVQAFAIRFKEAKKAQGVLDFNDLEHLALEILMDKDQDKIAPSEIALRLRKQYKEVLIDEYQDTNMVQETILKLLTHDEEAAGNLFMVGDVKQSIYRFRLAEPSLFLGKYSRYRLDGEKTGLRIDLAKNFRSRHEVLDITNFLFRQIMDQEVGEINYDAAQELKLGANFAENSCYETELLLVDMEKGEQAELTDDLSPQELQKNQLEAKAIVRKIEELVAKQFPIYDKKLGEFRPVTYRDIVILSRSMSGAPEIEEAMKERDIPFYVNSRTGYFEATEVAIMISLLKLIDNPYQDIPLASVLRSPIIGLNEEELGQIRAIKKRGYYFEAVQTYCQEKQDGLAEKLSDFLKQLNQWRELSIRENLTTLLYQIYNETNFYEFVGGLPGGKERQANLRALYDRAHQYENTAFRGLFRFIRFVERLELRGDDLGTAKTLGEKEDVVRMMTIHASKGLEFPVVIVAGINRRFNMRDIHAKVLLDKDYGFAASYTNVEKRLTYPTIMQQAIKQKKYQEMIAEEMRVLYVALTRAEEKLILLGTVPDWQKMLLQIEPVAMQAEEILAASERFKAKTYLEWISKSFVRHPDFGKQTGLSTNGHILPTNSRLQVTVYTHENLIQQADVKKEQQVYLENLKQFQPVQVQTEYQEIIRNRLEYVYPYKQQTKIRSKQSVTEIKRQFALADSYSDQEFIKQLQPVSLERPKFLQEKMLSPTEIGTAMHTVMQNIPIDHHPTAEELEALLQELVDREVLTEEQKNAINQIQILEFFQTELGEQLIENHSSVRREVPFSYLLPAQQVDENAEKEDTILIQGVIDSMIELQDEIILIDYKTDRIKGKYAADFKEIEPILKKRYQTQVSLYQEAVEQITQKQVNKAYLYFFDGGHICEMQNESEEEQ